MAKAGRSALRFIEDLYSRVNEAFKRETIELQEFRADTAHQSTDLFQPWEVSFWSEKQRKSKYDFDEEELRPYFPLDRVLGGMFQLAEKVFDLRITEHARPFMSSRAKPRAPPPAAHSLERPAPSRSGIRR
jgi:oligopeptidase A